MKDTIIALLNTDAVQTLIISGLVFLFGKLVLKVPSVKPFFDKYKGEMVRIIKLVEVEIPDGTTNKGWMRLDRALQYVIVLIEKAEKRKLSDTEKDEIRGNLSEAHLEVQASGGLTKKA